MARELVNRVDKIGITRAKMLARTEIINAHAEATLNTYDEAGLDGVTLLSEFSTAQDESVCPICEELSQQDNGNGPGVFTIEQARGVIPVHPNCRCGWLPIVVDPEGIILR
jgi:SPP1 gp7 family putative phage head morphogenesis protein